MINLHLRQPRVKIKIGSALYDNYDFVNDKVTLKADELESILQAMFNFGKFVEKSDYAPNEFIIDRRLH